MKPIEANQSEGAGATPAPTLSIRGVSKSFGAVVANKDVNLDLYAGEVHGLLGENGAGKSTLMNIVFGSLTPDEGEILFEGQDIAGIDTRHAIERGIAMVHQHFMLVPTLTVNENLLLSVRSTPEGRALGRRGILKKIEEVGAKYGIELDADMPIEALSVGEKLRLEIFKALLQGELRGGLKLFILDEPTALLTRQEIVALFQTLRSLADRGTAIVIITHKLSEVDEVCDRVSVLRDGHVVGTKKVGEITTAEMGRMMIGRDLPQRRHKPPERVGEVVLEVKDLAVEEDGRRLLDGISFELRAGEILGVAGVAGNGQELLAQCVTGLRRPSSGEARLNGKDITQSSRRDLIEREVAHVPEDRRLDALVVGDTIEHNSILGIQRWDRFQSRGWQRRREIESHSTAICADYEVRTPNAKALIGHLSGGNQQRVVIGRELGKSPALLVASGPTRGLDVAGYNYIHDCIIEQRDRGAAVLLISLDLDELLILSDRLLVMQGGRIQGELAESQFDIEHLGLMMGGGSGDGAEPVAVIPET